jgi:hypothetical protein
MAGLAGFEPTIEGSEPSALPLGYSPLLMVKSLHYYSISKKRLRCLKRKKTGYYPVFIQSMIVCISMAGPAGFEPTMRESKSLALPLGYGPN